MNVNVLCVLWKGGNRYRQNERDCVDICVCVCTCVGVCVSCFYLPLTLPLFILTVTGLSRYSHTTVRPSRPSKSGISATYRRRALNKHKLGLDRQGKPKHINKRSFRHIQIKLEHTYTYIHTVAKLVRPQLCSRPQTQIQPISAT